MKVYLSGQITGLSQETYTELFYKAAFTASSRGWECVNPLETKVCEDQYCGGGKVLDDRSQLHDYSCYMKYNIKAMLDCDAILLLPNWAWSKGAQIEHQVAIVCGLDVMYLDEDYQVML